MHTLPVLTTLIFLPLVAAFVLVFLKNEKTIRTVTLGASLLELAVALPLLQFAPQAGFQFVEMASWVPSLGLHYHLAVDGISILMVWLSIFTLPVCVLCSWSYIDKRIKEFHICLLMMTAACIGIFTALDFVLFYIFWEAMLIPMYLLIAVWGGDQRKYASIKFFIYTLAGSTLLLVAIIAFRVTGGTFDITQLMQQNFAFSFQFWAFLAMALAFAIKVPMFPFHTWLPAAHVQAPAAGSVLLAAILLKMGTYGFLRFCLALTPLASTYFAPLMIALSIISILYGGAVALGQNDIKKLIAYSSVAHMGFVTLGIFLFEIQGIQGALLQMLNHGIITGALFMMIGALYERSHSRAIEDNLGLGKYLPAFMFFWGLYGLASFGFPGTNGFVGEILVFASAFRTNVYIGALIVPGALLSAAYMFRVSLKMAWGQPSSATTWNDLNKREWAYLILPAIMVLVIGLAPGPFLKLVTPTAQELLNHHSERNVLYQTDTASPSAPSALEGVEQPPVSTIENGGNVSE